MASASTRRFIAAPFRTGPAGLTSKTPRNSAKFDRQRQPGIDEGRDQGFTRPSTRPGDEAAEQIADAAHHHHHQRLHGEDDARRWR